ncbi:MAG: GGDEF domain-containing protein [Candidatus Eisenbacteria bacterium]|uniref:GGDEF domain-containing protein n=1 Tax=Eiseniibacteriota bacterium TaxID=2212470 RepID=A0A956NCI7_UNCEI|nr:GGDEF domain-containing protein [Candidatus Eisenbacteria bacterium]
MDALRLSQDLLECIDLGPSAAREVWLHRTLERLRLAVGASFVSLVEDRDGQVTRWFVDRDGLKTEARELREGLAVRLSREPKQFLCGLAEAGSGFAQGIDGPSGFSVGTFALRSVPLESRSVWVVAGISRPDESWCDRSLALLEIGTRALRTALHIESEMERLEDLAMTDGLTLIPNYRYLRQVLEAEMERARRYGEVFSVVMVDVDNLKQYNAAHGHLAGSEVLQRIAAVLRREIRGSDTVAKYGGDEFLLVLPRTVASGALALSERIRRRLNETLVGRGGEALSCSFGVASFPKDGFDYEGLIASADRVLYEAKLDGRNRVVWTGESGTGGVKSGPERERVREISTMPGDRR